MDSFKSNNKVEISRDVINTIIKKAVLETEGIAGINDAGKSIINTISKKSKGINFTIKDNKIKAVVEIVVYYGCKINDTAAAVQNNVAEEIEAMTGMECVGVNVEVTDIIINENSEISEGE